MGCSGWRRCGMDVKRRTAALRRGSLQSRHADEPVYGHSRRAGRRSQRRGHQSRAYSWTRAVDFLPGRRIVAECAHGERHRSPSSCEWLFVQGRECSVRECKPFADGFRSWADRISGQRTIHDELWRHGRGHGNSSKLRLGAGERFPGTSLDQEWVLFGSDRIPSLTSEDLATAWQSFRRLPLSEEEFRTIAGNLAPYLK